METLQWFHLLKSKLFKMNKCPSVICGILIIYINNLSLVPVGLTVWWACMRALVCSLLKLNICGSGRCKDWIRISHDSKNRTQTVLFGFWNPGLAILIKVMSGFSSCLGAISNLFRCVRGLLPLSFQKRSLSWLILNIVRCCLSWIVVEFPSLCWFLSFWAS